MIFIIGCPKPNMNLFFIKTDNKFEKKHKIVLKNGIKIEISSSSDIGPNPPLPYDTLGYDITLKYKITYGLDNQNIVIYPENIKVTFQDDTMSFSRNKIITIKNDQRKGIYEFKAYYKTRIHSQDLIQTNNLKEAFNVKIIHDRFIKIDNHFLEVDTVYALEKQVDDIIY